MRLRPSARGRRRQGWGETWGRAVLAAVPIVAAITFTAQATWSAIVTPRRAAVAAAPAPAPAPVAGGAADIASPATGSTGTIALPPEPFLPAASVADGTIVAARPFFAGRASALDRGRALECLTAAIYYEAASEPDDGQRAVAQVVLNRVRHSAFPGTICGVVYQGSERGSGCQFSFACDGATARLPTRAGWARAMRHAAAALAGQVYAPVGLATHYHTYAVTPAWNRTLVMTDAIGAHFFHRWKGYWGTAAAFAKPYRGGEPVPGPYRRIGAEALPLPGPATPVLPAITPAPAITAAKGETAAPNGRITELAMIQPRHAESGMPIAPAGDADSQILDRWKDSGRPLR